mmetsp:Transcript_79640/g.258101  ORF Transcript_79640/g.258101 Transcript_79640/m.258101 type:complete len:483 (-) Transcript_79640:269-1717(-)
MAMRPSTSGGAWPSSAFLLVATLACCTRVHAQVYELAEVNMPGSFTLQTNYHFFITSNADDAKAGSGQGRLGAATVNFKDLRLTPKNNEPSAPSASKLDGYSSVQVSLIPVDKFWNIVDAEQFCDRNKLHFKGGDTHDEVVTFNVGADAASHIADLKFSGPYALTITNCGDLTGLAITGSVEVKNPWGFLPAIEFNKKAFYAGASVFYVITALVWTALAVQWWNQLFSLQKVLTTIVWIGVIESVAGWAMLEKWNSGGSLPSVLFLMTTLTFTWKFVAIVEMLIVAPGKGTSEDVSLKGHAALLSFMMAVFHYKVVMAFRHCYNIQMTQVYLNSMPVALMFAILIVWTYSTLGSSIEMLEEQKDQNKLAMYQKLRIVAGIGALGAGLCGALQILDPTVADTKLWGYHFLPSDGAFQILYAVLLSTCMVICLPSQDTQGYDYAVAQVEGETIGAPNSVWDDEDCEEAKNEPANKSGDDLMPVE